MTDKQPAALYRFGIFELDTAKGELRRRGLRVKLHAQPFQILTMLLERPDDILTREEIARVLWPDGTFVDFEHGVNSAINRLRDTLGDKASNPRFVETLARRGYRWLAPVERIPTINSPSAIATGAPAPTTDPPSSFLDRVLASEQDLPQSSHTVVQTLFLLLQLMYLGFYIGALANLAEINDLLSSLPHAAQWFLAMIVTAAVMIPVRTFLCFAVLFRAPGLREKYRKLWMLLLPLDLLWALAPFLLLHHINSGVALACMTFLVYSPLAQRSLILMGAGSTRT
jgi:DNA-binding winged helix-turn-helix (wHTH) protein